MSLQLNRIMLAGNLTRDPQIKIVAKSVSLADFGVAINRRWKDKDGNVMSEATFLDVEAWGKTADFIGQFFAKGSGIYIEGRMKLETWNDKEGNKRSRLKVVAENVSFTTSKASGIEGESVNQETGEVTRTIHKKAGAK